MRSTAIIIVLVTIVAGSSAAQNTNLTGVVRNTAGVPISRALVKVNNDKRGLGFMVVSQEQGWYRTPNLLPGKYTIQAFGGDSQSAPGVAIEIGNGRVRKMDLVLSSPLQIPPRKKGMTDVDYAKLMPEGEGKDEVVGHCIQCHSLEWVVSARKTPEKWRETVDRMYDGVQSRLPPLWLAMREDDGLYPLIVNYLAKNLGPEAPLDPRMAEQSLPYPGIASSRGPSQPSKLAPTLLQGAAAKYVVMEFSLPPGSAPNSIAVDSKSIAWVAEGSTGMLGRFDPNLLTYTRIAAPPGQNPTLQFNAIAVDSSDQVWFADDGPNARIFQYNPRSREFNSYPIPDYPFPVPDIGGARVATLRFLEGNVWATRMTAQRILKLDPRTSKITEYAVPRGSMPFGLAVGANNMIWYTAAIGNVVVRLDPSSGTLTPYDVPTRTSPMLSPKTEMRGMAADAEGSLWIAATRLGKIVNVDTRTGNAGESAPERPGILRYTTSARTGNYREFAPPSEESGPVSVDVDTKRNLVWFSEVLTDRIGRFDPRSGSFVEFPLPGRNFEVHHIEIDRAHSNRVWWSATRADKIGYVEVIE